LTNRCRKAAFPDINTGIGDYKSTLPPNAIGMIAENHASKSINKGWRALKRQLRALSLGSSLFDITVLNYTLVVAKNVQDCTREIEFYYTFLSLTGEPRCLVTRNIKYDEPHHPNYSHSHSLLHRLHLSQRWLLNSMLRLKKSQSPRGNGKND
jgi:hypothetical protein